MVSETESPLFESGWILAVGVVCLCVRGSFWWLLLNFLSGFSFQPVCKRTLKFRAQGAASCVFLVPVESSPLAASYPALEQNMTHCESEHVGLAMLWIVVVAEKKGR